MKFDNYSKFAWLQGLLFLVLQREVDRSTQAFVLFAISQGGSHRSTDNGLFRLSGSYSTACSSTKNSSNEQQESIKENRRIVARRWNGNYKHKSTNLSDVPKAKKLQLELSVQHADGTIATKMLQKKRQETLQHVLTKAMLWKLYCDEYPSIEIEHDIGDPDYLPDVISLDADSGSPLFWGESGRMKVHKAMDLMQRYPQTHIVHCRWDMTCDEIASPLQEHLQELLDSDALGDLPRRPGRFTFCSIPLDVWRFIDEDSGRIHLRRDELDWKELEFPTIKSSATSIPKDNM